jgi:hypothetical protein
VAWQVRDFADARFVPRLARGTDVSLVITPYRPEPPALGARYVGQDFIVTRTWNLASLRWEDVPIWILQREAQAPAQIGEQAVIWLREDVYGLPPAEETDSSGEESTP